MPKVLSHSACTMLWVIRLVVACGDCWFIVGRLLRIDFLSYIVWVSEDVVIYIYAMHFRGGISLFLKKKLFIFLGFLSYNCWYFDMVFKFVLTCILL